MPARKVGKPSARPARRPAPAVSTRLLAGDNPQVAKADGDAAIQTYIDAMPGWKRDIGSGLDALIVAAVPTVRKPVKWNSPFYGVGDGDWFLSFHCCTEYVKVAFFRGAHLQPLPPDASKQRDVRYLDIRKNRRHRHDDIHYMGATATDGD